MSVGLPPLFSAGSDSVLLDRLGRWYFLQFEALRVNGEGGMLSTGSGGGSVEISCSAFFISSDKCPSEEERFWTSLLPPGASLDRLREMSRLDAEEMGFSNADKFLSSERIVLERDAVQAGFRLPSDTLLNHCWLFLTSFCSDACLPIDGEENIYGYIKKQRLLLTQIV